jgi:hypothetical protein
LLFIQAQALFIDIALEALVYGQQAAAEELVRDVLHYHRESCPRGNLGDSVPHCSSPYDSYGFDHVTFP